MAAALTPIKVASETDQLIAHAAHFLKTSKKDVVDRAVRDYVEGHRDEINDGIRAALAQLDGTNTSAVSMMTGLSSARLSELGGVPED
jgi:hypothetical protein